MKTKSGATQIYEERSRQITEEHYNKYHDEEHTDGKLADAAIAYIIHGQPYKVQLPNFWPFQEKYFKPKDRIRNLVRAGALIAAEIDRLQDNL